MKALRHLIIADKIEWFNSDLSHIPFASDLLAEAEGNKIMTTTKVVVCTGPRRAIYWLHP